MTTTLTRSMARTLAPLAASSSARLPNAPVRRRVGWSVAVSVLLHLALLVLAIVAAHHKRSLPEAVPPAPVAMVFEGGGNAPPSVANPAPVSPNHQASPAPQTSAPPQPRPAPPVQQPTPLPPPPVEQPPPQTAPPVEAPSPQKVLPPAPKIVPPAPEAAAPPTPKPVQPVPPVQEVAPPAPKIVPLPQEAAPAPAPKATPRPPPEISAPQTTAPAAQAPERVPLPLPPPAPVPAPRAAPQTALARPPQPREALRPIAPPRGGPAFPAPLDFSLGPRPAVPEAAPPPQPHASHGTIDLSFAPMMGGGDITQLHPQGKGDDVGADWFNEVSAWWLRHRFYPDEAARLQQEGDVTLRLIVGRGGRVEAVHVQERSGSPWLDLGALAVFRDANLPPLPPDVRDPNITVDFTIHYEIVR